MEPLTLEEVEIIAQEEIISELSPEGLHSEELTEEERREHILVHEDVTYYFTFVLGLAVVGAVYLVIYHPSAQ